MIDKNILDNLKGQEIKELIVDGKITLEDLDTSALEKLFDYETDMLCIDEGDIELINACAERMDELNGPLMTEEHFWAVINKVDAEMVSDKKENTPVDAPVNAPARVVKKRIIWKKVWLVAAIIVLLISAATITASAFGFNVFDYFKQVISLPVGENVEQGVITLINFGETKTFSSVDKLLAEEKIETMYPTVLPEGVVIKQVNISENTNHGTTIQFIMNIPSTIVSVDTNSQPFEVNGYMDSITIAKCVFYIFSDNGFYAICHYDNCYYYIGSDSYENLVLIIENMREVK